MGRWQEGGKRLVVWARATAPARLLQRYLADDLPNWAAAIAYHAFFALFPLLLSLLTLTGLVLRDPARLAALTSTIVQLFPAEAAEPLLAVLQGTREHVGLLGLVSLLGLLYSASALFGSLEHVFDRIYRVPERGFLRQKVMATGMLLLFALLLLLSLTTAGVAALVGSLSQEVAATVPWLPWLSRVLESGALVSAVSWALSVGWTFLLFWLIYWIVPNRPLAPGQVWPGALAATVLFQASTQLFPLYLRHVGQFNRYGAAFGLALLLLTWFYFLAHILLFGATLNAFLEDERTAAGASRAAPSPAQEALPQGTAPAGRAAEPGAGAGRTG
ncbi:MAG TPA: YihY/virulence factor BrkB family protein [Chloroflexota bacterium]|nr:YihY/virulence factor BrkB family protein [Chloroflexota bacterium]